MLIAPHKNLMNGRSYPANLAHWRAKATARQWTFIQLAGGFDEGDPRQVLSGTTIRTAAVFGYCALPV
jgi:hypothetical protein